jgi:beta-phosphoglucomutase-like phosphatase (HAD superfamily)
MRQQIETLLFDFGGTLDCDGVAWKERMQAHYRSEGLAISPEEFARAFYAADDSLVGGLPEDADLAVTVHSLACNLEAALASREGRDPSGNADSRRAGKVAARFLAEAEAGFGRNRPLLERLGQRYRLGVVSNFYGNLEAVCRAAGLAPPLAVMIDSQKLGAEKPDPAIFQAALDALGARAGTTLMVGDSLPRDREGARRMKMQFVWIAPAEVQAAEIRARGSLDHPVVARLGDLEGILS